VSRRSERTILRDDVQEVGANAFDGDLHKGLAVKRFEAKL